VVYIKTVQTYMYTMSDVISVALRMFSTYMIRDPHNLILTVSAHSTTLHYSTDCVL